MVIQPLSEYTKVLEFLNTHRELFFIILEAETQIRKYFLNDKLSLKISTDPEIVNYEVLTITIHTSLDANRAFDLLKELDNNWWLDVFAQVGNKLNIHVDFVNILSL